MGLLVIGLMVVSLVLSLGLTAIVKRVALGVGFVDRPGVRKIHHVPKALGGGIAILLAMVIPMVGGLMAVKYFSFGEAGGVGRLVAVHREGILHQGPLALKFLIAMVAMHVLGLVDDRRALGP